MYIRLLCDRFFIYTLIDFSANNFPNDHLFAFFLPPGLNEPVDEDEANPNVGCKQRRAGREEFLEIVQPLHFQPVGSLEPEDFGDSPKS